MARDSVKGTRGGGAKDTEKGEDQVCHKNRSHNKVRHGNILINGIKREQRGDWMRLGKHIRAEHIINMPFILPACKQRDIPCA